MKTERFYILTSQVKILLVSGIQSIQQESHMKIHNLALTKHLQSKQFQLEIVSTISDYWPNFLIGVEVLKMFLNILYPYQK